MKRQVRQRSPISQSLPKLPSSGAFVFSPLVSVVVLHHFIFSSHFTVSKCIMNANFSTIHFCLTVSFIHRPTVILLQLLLFSVFCCLPPHPAIPSSCSLSQRRGQYRWSVCLSVCSSDRRRDEHDPNPELKFLN